MKDGIASEDLLQAVRSYRRMRDAAGVIAGMVKYLISPSEMAIGYLNP